MRLLLDEMWSHEIAAQLRRRGHDALAPDFNRRRGSRVIGPAVDALDGFLTDHPSDEALDAAHYLRRRR